MNLTNSISVKFKLLSIFIKYLSVRRILNFIALKLSFYSSFFKIIKLKNLSPYFISVELSNYCNLHCPECPVGISTKTKADKKLFNIEMFKSLIDELTPTLLHVILYFQGEPFINKLLPEFIHYAHKARIFTSISTNGQFITKNNAKEIVESGLDKLIVSVDGITQGVYEKYRVGGSLDKALDGIRQIVYWKNELKSVTPFVEMQCIVLKTNEHQLSEMKQTAKLLHVNRLIFKTAQLYDFKNGNKLMPSNKKYSRYKKLKDGTFRIKSSQPNRCERLWSGAVVNANGEVLPCCFDKTLEHSFGNIQNQSFAMSWHTKNASDFREKILQNRKQFEMCRNCTE